MAASRKSKLERDREKQVQDRLQVLITQMLRDEDNKYCVDCDGKGPRWSSWNLGLFLCIKCAGIHRNLGVHISKVKSVNLDSWTPVQVASMQLMGNSRARAIYEANLPDGFLRPQNNQSLEQFIRTKYEKKKYIAREFVPQKTPEFPDGWYELIEAEKQKKDIRKIVLPSHNNPPSSPTKAASGSKPGSPAAAGSAGSANLPTKSSPAKTAALPAAAAASKPRSSDDLFGLGIAVGGGDADLLGIASGLSLVAPPSSSASAPPSNTGSSSDFAAFVSAAPLPNPPSSTSAASSASATIAQSNDSEKDFFSQTSAAVAEDKAKSTKDSIMALFGEKKPQQQQQNNGFGQPQPPQQQQQMFSSFQPAGGLGFPASAPPASNPAQFGVNPQSNPFLNSTTSPNPAAAASAGNMNFFAAQPSSAGINQAQNQFGGLNSAFGNMNFGQMQPPQPSSAQPQPLKPSSAAAANDILGLF